MTDQANNQSGQQGQQQANSGANGAGSNDGSNQSGQQNQPQAPTRPAALADKAFDGYWDAKDGVKFDAFAKDFNDLRGFKAQQDLRTAGVPKTKDDYKIALPQTFKAPVDKDGKPIEVKINEADPRIAHGRALAHELGIDQAGFSRFLEMFVSADLADQQDVNAGRAKEQEKLGLNGPQRIDAIHTVIESKIGSDKAQALMDRLVLASDVEAMEDLIKHFSTQGGANFTGLHRDGGKSGALTEEEYQKLPLSERRQYQLSGARPN